MREGNLWRDKFVEDYDTQRPRAATLRAQTGTLTHKAGATLQWRREHWRNRMLCLRGDMQFHNMQSMISLGLFYL